MIIKKILNNNVVITLNEHHEEIVVMGKGLAYGKKTGDYIDPSKINKTFEVSLKESQKKMINMLKDIPIEYMEISDEVIQKARKDLDSDIDDSLYISLTDHIHTSIERYKEGIPLKNQLLFEIKHFYKKEYELGLWALSLIQDKYHIAMDEDEAGFIAMHIVSSEIGRNISDVYEMTNFIQEILKLVRDYFQRDFDEESLAYYRFATHLKFFGLRVFNQSKHHQEDSLNNDLLEIMKEKYVQPYLCALEIKNFIEKKYQYELEDEEILFLTIHVAKIISNK
ncbi:MAG: BglG family transcription antiterminator LicT [Longibaculum sp.]